MNEAHPGGVASCASSARKTSQTWRRTLFVSKRMESRLKQTKKTNDVTV